MMWQPNATINTLRRRSQILASIRQFFAQKSVMEVETPCLSQATVTDQHLASFETTFIGPGFAAGLPLYLQTSPEYGMKRLLAAGSGCIYQIAKAFRNEEAGRFHNPEFTLLEWYRLGFDHFDLMNEVDELLRLILNTDTAERQTYQQVFMQWVGCDPLTADMSRLQQAMAQFDMHDLGQRLEDRDSLLQCLFVHVVEPNIGQSSPTMIYDFPASQAALACLSPANPQVAERFEVYYQGIELANGFHELTDADEQRCRFEADNHKRQREGLTTRDIDQRLLDALAYGLPPCAGVALGIDRLLMLAVKADTIADVVTFDIHRA